MLNITPFLKQYSAFRGHQLNTQDVSKIQRRQLLTLLKKARTTRFGIQYHFKSITSIEEYQRTVPLRSYDDFWREFWSADFPLLVDCTWPGKIPYFALTAGTTESIKHIPLSREMIRSNAKASVELLCHHLANRPQSRILGGKGYMFVEMADFSELRHQTYAGSLPDLLLYKTMPWLAKPWYFSPIKDIAPISDPEERMATLASLLLQQDLHSLSGFPPMLLYLFQYMHKLHAQGEQFRIADYFPHLEMLVHSGVSMTPYRKRFTDALEGSHCDFRELYASSEGVLAIADRQPGEGLRLICDHGVFYEFVPFDELHQANPTRCWIGNVQIGVDYAIVLSTSAGLWSYLLGDVVQFVDLNPPRLLITGRTANTLSVFGEKVLEEQLSDAVTTAAAGIGVTVAEFTVSASYPQNPGEQGRYRYILEFLDAPPVQEDLWRFTELIEQTLRRNNGLYDAAQLGSYGFDRPDLLFAAPGAFQAWLKTQGKSTGKVPRIMADSEKFNAFLAFAQEYKRLSDA